MIQPYIIAKKNPDYYTDLDNKESIQLTYDDYYILIYKGEDLKTYVQISSRKYIHQNGYHSLYRPYRRNIIVFYDDSYRLNGYYKADSKRYSGGYYKSTQFQNENKIRTDSDYSNKIKTGSSPNSKSVRSGSTKSRSSLGGGISFGK